MEKQEISKQRWRGSRATKYEIAAAVAGQFRSGQAEENFLEKNFLLLLVGGTKGQF